MTLPREARDSRVFFVRCEVLDASGKVVAENVYWQSQQQRRRRRPQRGLRLRTATRTSWADMTAAQLDAAGAAGRQPRTTRRSTATVRTGARSRPLHNPTQAGRVLRARRGDRRRRDGDEILPIEYDDNYVTVFPGETVDVRAAVPRRSGAPVSADWVRVTGYNTPPVVVPVS